MTFPTKKSHVSFSEIKKHKECNHKHWLHYVKKIDLFEPNVHTEFGKVVHDGCEHYLKTDEMDFDVAIKKIQGQWKEYDLPDVDDYIFGANRVLEEVPVFLDLTFPGWEPVAAEATLYEPLPQREGLSFKGYIDAIIKVGDIYWVLDWKTCSKPWKKWKREEELLKYQLIYYRDFWAAKNKIKREQVKCGFVTLAYGSDVKMARCELIEVEPTRERRVSALKVLNEMIDTVQSRRHNKRKRNKWGSNCKFCDYLDTEYCT